MPPRTTGSLEVAGVSLYYELHGHGPALLMIPGGNGDAGPFEKVADRLADRYTVILYDRRGYSRSLLQQPPEDDHRLAIDCQDAVALLDLVTAEPAAVFGTSAGAIVALHLIIHSPGRIGQLIAHETPLVTLLPDASEWLRFHEDLYATYQRDGLEAAMRAFVAGVGLDRLRPATSQAPSSPAKEEQAARTRRNQVFWLEHELRQYPRAVPDMKALARVADRIVLAGGTTSRDHYPYRPNLVLGKTLGRSVVDFPGGHIGYVTHPVEFAERLAEVLAVRR